MEEVKSVIAAVKDEFVSVVVSNARPYAIAVHSLESEKYEYAHHMCAIWLNTIIEIENALNDLLQNSLETIYINQRRTFFSARFAMEGVADLLYLEKNPDDAKKAITSKDFHLKLLEAGNNQNRIIKDKAVADALRNENKLSQTILSRISAAFPGEGLTQYSILCLFTHHNDLGNQLFARITTRDYLDLYYQVFKSLRMAMEKLADYMFRDPNYNVSETGLKNLVSHFRTTELLIYKSVSRQINPSGSSRTEA